MAENYSVLRFGGKVDGLIGYRVRGKDYLRSRPAVVRNPRTEAQQSHRRAFALVSSFVATLKGAYLVGYKNYRPERSPRVRMTEHVFGEVLREDGTLDMRRLKVAQGPLQALIVNGVEYAEGRLRVEFGKGNGSGDDKLQMVLYNKKIGAVLVLEDEASRRGSAATVEVPEEWREDHVYVYGFWRNGGSGQVSDSVLVAELNGEEGNWLARREEEEAFVRLLSRNWVRIRYKRPETGETGNKSGPPD